jgi:hypothetical protein
MTGMTLLGFLTIQPFTELANHFLNHKYPRIYLIGHVHIWSGRLIMLVGMIHGGMGFKYSKKLDGELPMRKGPWPRVVPVLYGTIAGVVAVAYVATLRYVELRNRKRDALEADTVSEGPDMEQQRPFVEVRSIARKASQATQGRGAEGLAQPDVMDGVKTKPKSPSPLRMSSVKRIFRSDAL